MTSRRRLLLIGWDAADWKLIHPLLDAGQLPHLQRLVEHGTSGNLATLEPPLSPLLWTSIATGKHAYQHGVLGFTEVDPATGLVVAVSAATRRCQTLWELLAKRGLKSHVVNWFATQGERLPHGCLVANTFAHFPHNRDQDPATWPAPAQGTYWPESLAERLNPLRVSPWDIDGDEIIRLFVPEAPRIDQQRDRRLWDLAEKLAETFSTHAAACHLLEQEPEWDFAAIYYRGIDELGHDFMPFHPPRLPTVAPADFELYQHVMEATYKLHDLLLGRLMQLAGPETAVVVVSDHGFHSDHLRPLQLPEVRSAITQWHRPQGIFVAQGPGIAQDALLHGARLLDITPTILHWFGLPVGADMEGRVLSEVFAADTPVTTIPTWESPGEVQRHPRLPASEQQAVLEQLVALGYLDPLPADAGLAAAECELENDWSLARACMDVGRFEQALPLLESLFFRFPERQDFCQTLSLCQRKLGLHTEARHTLEACLDLIANPKWAALIRARAAAEAGDHHAVLAQLEHVRDRAPRDLRLLDLLGQTLLHLRRWHDCAEVCRTALGIDRDNILARLGLARCALAQKQPQLTVDHALEAIGLHYGNPWAHLLLGLGLRQLGRRAEAIQAFRVSLKLNPQLRTAARLLAGLEAELGLPHQAAVSESDARRRQLDESVLRSRQVERLRHESAQRAQEFLAARAKLRESERLRREQNQPSLAPGTEFVIVSGLPRSGTSLMMQMLAAAGLTPMTDGVRTPDLDNPLGYYEWEEIRQLPQRPYLIEKAQGKVCKVISPLLKHLPQRYRYHVIFMSRPIEEVLASQARMRAHRGEGPASSERELRTALTREDDFARRGTATHDGFRLQIVDYHRLIESPDVVATEIADFLKSHGSLDTAAMVAQVRPTLYRQRLATTGRSV